MLPASSLRFPRTILKTNVSPLQQQAWSLNLTASLAFNLVLPKPRQRFPYPKKIKYFTETLPLQQYGIKKLVYLTSKRRTYLVVKRANPTTPATATATATATGSSTTAAAAASTPAAAAAKPAATPSKAPAANNKSNIKEEEENLAYVFIPNALKVNLPTAEALTFTYHKNDQNLYQTFFKELQQTIEGKEIFYKKKLILKGLGFRMSLENNDTIISFKLGYANLIEKEIPSYISSAKMKKNMLILESTNKALLGSYAASIQRIKPPETYKEKGIYFSGETVKLKQIKKK